MALAFPRALLGWRFKSFSLELQRDDFMSPERSGRIGNVSAGPPLWMLQAVPAPQTEVESEAWAAWIDSHRGAQRPFLARDVTRPYPLAYPKGFGGLTRFSGGAFNGSATGWSLDGTRSVLTLQGMPVGFRLRPGDRVGFTWTQRAMAKALEDVTATAGGVLTTTIEPALPALVPGSATVWLLAPECLMRLKLPETRIGEMGANRIKPITLVAVQELLA